jgi:hypothetical protein
VSSTSEPELPQADVHYDHDRLSLLRAKLYRWGLGSSARSRALERRVEAAERRLRDHRSRERPLRAQGLSQRH